MGIGFIWKSFLELTFELSSLRHARGRRNWGLVRFAAEVRDTFPYTLALHLFSPSYLADSLRYKAVIFSSDAGDCGVCALGGEDGCKMGRAAERERTVSWFSLPLTLDSVCPQEKLRPSSGAQCLPGPRVREGEGGFR